MSRLAVLSFATVLAAVPVFLNAAPALVADFNDCALGDMRQGKTNNQPANTGTGFGAPYWEGNTGVIVVVAGDLTAPAATHYAAGQTGAAQAVQSRGASSTTRRQQYRELEDFLTGTVWGSFLVRQSDATTPNTGLTFNVASTDPMVKSGQGRLYAAGNSLLLHAWGDTSPILAANQFVVNQTALVVFRFDTTTRQLDVWVDPVLPTAAGDLSTATAAFSARCDLVGPLGGFQTLGVGGYPDTTATGNCGIVDAIRLGTGDYGYYDVTGLPALPHLITNPAAATIARGGTATFQVTAVAQGTLAYQWQKDGADLAGATEATLTLTGVPDAAAGNYRVVVRDTDSSGTVWSAPATLTVLSAVTPVTITVPPTSQGVAVGSPVTFGVTATGTPPLSFAWQKDGSVIVGATSASYALAAAQPADAGLYRVVVTNPAGSVTSAEATLSVHVAPQIVAPPQNAESYAGGSATFFVDATGSDLVYQWTHGGVAIPGAGATLTLTNLQAADEGSYVVAVSNALGSLTSAAATLTVSASPPVLVGAVSATADSYIENGTQKAANRNALSLLVGARNTSGSTFKTYLAFDLPAGVRAADASNAAVKLTLHATEPFVNATSSASTNTLAAAAAMSVREGYDSVAQTYLTTGPVTAGSDLFRSLLTFDLASLSFVPSSVSLRLTVAAKWSGAAAGKQTLRLYRVTTPWVMAQASWTRASNDALWSTPGGDLDATVLSEVAADPSTVAAGGLVTFPDTAALRQAMLDVLDTDGLLHLAVVVASETTASNRVFQFQPRGTAAVEPVLVFPAGTLSSNAPKNPVRLRLHGVVNNGDAWTETGLTWTNASAKAESITSVGAGAVPLAELTLDAGTLAGGATVRFTDPRLTQFLNWAAGRRGDLYGTGQASDTGRRVTFIVTSLETGDAYAAVKFQDRESGTAPALEFDTTGTKAAAATQLENDRFRVALQPDLTLTVTDKTDGGTATFAAEFEVINQSASPAFSRLSYSVSPITISMPTWSSSFNYGSAAGVRETLRPVAARAIDGQFVWSYRPTAATYGLRAVLDLPSGSGFPRLRWTLSPTAQRYFAVAFQPTVAVSNTDVTAFYLPGPWDGRRFPEYQFVCDEVRATLPAVLRESGGVTTGVAVDPFEVPNRVATTSNALFGLLANDPTTRLSRPAVLAPIYGGVGSSTDGTQSFAVRLVVGGRGLDQAFRDVATGVFGFHDYRENLPGGSLNTSLDNLVDFILNTSGQNFSYWQDLTKANEYVNDDPDYVRFQSAPAALSLAMVRDDANLYERRARPTIEYFISRHSAMMDFKTYDPTAGMGGPVAGYYGTDFFALYGLAGRRTYAFLPLAEEARAVSNGTTPLTAVVKAGQALGRGETYDRMFDTLQSLIEGYRSTGLAEYLTDARWLADEYLRYRYAGAAPADFRDVKSSFWNQISGRWELLLEMEGLTGDARYGAAAAQAMNEFARHVNFGPAVNDLTVDGLGSPVKSAYVSEVGLTSEATATSVSHRGIFMSAYASPSFLRVAREQQDPFFAAVGRAGIVGRWLNYPGYTIRNNYNPVLLQADYPLRWYSSYANTAHMNHPLPLATMAIDFLLADAELKSANAVRFPHHFTDSRGYFRGQLFGGEPGVFYGDSGVWPWLPRALVTLAGTDAVQLNYVAGHGNGRLYLAFSNQSPRPVTAVVTVDSARVALTGGARLRAWRDNLAQADATFENGVTTVTVAPGGFTAWAIDGATPVLALQADYGQGAGGKLTAASYDRRTAPFGTMVGTILSLSPTRQSAYVYADSDPTVLNSARLRYRIDGGAEQSLTKAQFPFEFTVPLAATTQSFSYIFEGTPVVAGGTQTSAEVSLSLLTAPEITMAPVATTTVAGKPASLSLTVSGSGTFTYQWRKNGAAITGATDATLALTGAPGETGSYDVVVSNAVGSVTSSPVVVTVDVGNLLAYALGLAGDAEPPKPAVWYDAAVHRLNLSFLRARADVVYTVQASDDLQTWTSVAVNPGAIGSVVVVTDSVVVDDPMHRFLRLQVALP